MQKKVLQLTQKNSNDYFKLLDFHIKSKDKVISKILSRKAQFYHYLLHNSLMSYPFDKPSGIQKLKTKNFFKNGIVNNFKETFDSLSMNNEEWRKSVKNKIKNKVNL